MHLAVEREGAARVAAFQDIIEPNNNQDVPCLIELITGSAVIDLLLNPGFQKDFDRLFNACPWATVFQDRLYITAWYQAYQEKHLPVLIKGEINGYFIGVLPMVLLHTQANDRRVYSNGNRITGVGHYDAEYQTWLAVPAHGESFIRQALDKLIKQFPGNPISFRYLPPGTPLNWIKEDKKWRSYSTAQSHTRPLIKLSEPDHAKLLESRQFKNKLNRLKRLGEVQLEPITNLEIFKSYLDELSVLYDFRFGALYNKHIFRDDPVKKEFLIELFRSQLIHATVLKVDREIYAAVVAISGKGWLHLSGFTCHSPFKARSYSPGLLHFSFLAQKLRKECMQYLDLTPGYDSYKEKLANMHDEVYELVVSRKLTYRIKKRIKIWMHNRLIVMGIRPMTVELKVKKYIYRLRHIHILTLLKKLAERFTRKAYQKRYVINTPVFKSGGRNLLHENNLNHLLQFQTDKATGITRWEFLADAMYRLETGQYCYTWIENGKLLSCAWFNFPDASSKEGKSSQEHNYDIELKELYCYIKDRDKLRSFIFSMIDHVASEKNDIGIRTNNKFFSQAMEAIGLKAE
ncbi:MULTISPECIES: GNAT family N-acetyltransferase [Niastella]|uniref:GNAT family N-acetyltransferase n=1 Tax=Niastella soli TaxID=2821487 RepID=A0ABS3YYS3_9BACT|nr:GNAT family N-acetyltransferase [Niastella soli]MBO9203070.1 GNAT family N-acetyltransferase [Niastella soli]